MRTTTFTVFQSSVATSFAGGIYIDIPVDGTIVGIHGSMVGTGNAGAVSHATAELSRLATDQSASAVGRGILFSMASATTAGSSATAANHATGPMAEPIRQGERLYLNFRNAGANWVNHVATVNITVQHQ